MKFNLIIILFTYIFHYSFTIVPKWNIGTAAIDLKPSFSDNKLIYAKVSLGGHDLNGILRKELILNGDIIKKKSYLSINNEPEFEIFFEDIESIYYIANKRIICPKGNHHPKVLENNNFQELFPLNIDFEEKGNWDLKCYFHGAGLDDGGNSQKSPGNGFFMLFYLMNGINSNYNTDLNKDNYNFYWEANR